MGTVRRVLNLFRRQRVDIEIEEELRSHIEMRAADNIAAGMPPEEARRQAVLRFGSRAAMKERVIAADAQMFLDSLWQDLCYGLRMLRKSPGFTAVAILTLSLGIGANTAIFSLVNGILLRQLPYRQPQRLIALTGDSGWDDVFPQGAIVAMQDQLRTMDIAGFSSTEKLNLTGVGAAVRLQGTAVSANLFSLLGVQPELGRVFVTGEDQPGRDNILMLSDALWRQKFKADPNVIGHSVALEGVERFIVGVMPPDFQLASAKAQFWIPLHLDSRNAGSYWGGGFMPVVGRLRPGANLAQARSEIRALVPQLRRMFPWQMPDALWADAGAISLQQSIAGNVSAKLLLLLACVAFVLLIACANVANLLLARAATRHREMAVRSALGASCSRIFRQLLIESAVMSLMGASLGLFLAEEGIEWLKIILPPDTPRLSGVSLDWRVVGFTAAIAILTAIIFGFAPALQASKIDLTGSLKTGGQQSTASNASRRLRNSLVIAEIAVVALLVIGAGLLVRSLWALSHVNPGFRTESIISARVTPNENFCPHFDRCRNFYADLLARVRTLPGVADDAAVSMLPLKLENRAFAAEMEGRPRDPREPAPVLLETAITPGYLRLMGIPVIRGRAFIHADMAAGAPPVALVTAATANAFWPHQDAVGKHLRPVFDKPWITIVGVVGDVTEANLASKWSDWVSGAIYEPYGNGRGKLLPTEMTIVVRTQGPHKGLAEEIQNVAASLNPQAPVSEVRTMRTIVSESMAAPRSTMSLFAIFAALALALGAIGIYGVVSYSVAQRTGEFGMRMALGAQRRDILGLILGHALRTALIGVGIGLAGAFAATRLMVSLLYGISPTDPFTFAAVAIGVVSVALLASWLPARRAMKVDPMVALRYE